MLNSQVEEVIKKYYKGSNNDLFIEMSSQKIELTDKIINFCSHNSIQTTLIERGLFPSKEWYFEFPKFAKNEFEVTYTSILTVSKLANIYSLEHQFEVLNKDDKRISPTLDGSSEDGYNYIQFDFDSLVRNEFGMKTFDRLFYREAMRKVEGINFSEDVILFGPDVTQEDILFRDVLDILPD